MVSVASLLSVLTASAYAQAPPQFMDEVCGGAANIEKWNRVPHDLSGIPNADKKGDSKGQWKGKDFWYYNDDWRELIANGDKTSELIHTVVNGVQVLKKCNVAPIKEINFVKNMEECRRSCAFSSSSTDTANQKCKFFAYNIGDGEENTGICRHYYTCPNWWNTDVDANSDRNWEWHRLIDIYPAGFKDYQLSEFNQPPACFHVEQSANKKVEVMIEADSKDARICIRDGRDPGVNLNNVGNVSTCDNGQLYACFTAAEAQNSDFYFYVYCDESCEASDVPIWVRVRVSEGDWSTGKTNTADDIEMWCEMEKESVFTTTTKIIQYGPDGKAQTDVQGNVVKQDETIVFNDFTWPSELNPREPRSYTIRVNKNGLNSAAFAPMALFSFVLTALLGLLW